MNDVNLDYIAKMIELKPYDPIGIECVKDTDYFSVKVHDRNNNYPDVWIDVTVNTDYLDCDYNMWIFHKNNHYEQSVKAFMQLGQLFDGYLYGLCTECVETYLIANDFIRYDYVKSEYEIL